MSTSTNVGACPRVGEPVNALSRDGMNVQMEANIIETYKNKILIILNNINILDVEDECFDFKCTELIEYVKTSSEQTILMLENIRNINKQK